MSLVRRGRFHPYAVGAARAGNALYRGFRVGNQLKRSFQGQNRNGSSNKRQRMRRGASGAGVTREHDLATTYRRKRMPGRKRRAWKKFVKKVDAVAEKHAGTTSVLFNQSLTKVAAANTQVMYGITLYGAYGETVAATGEAYYSDLERLTLTSRTTSVGVNVRNRHITFKSAVLDVTVVNIDTSSCELDMYEFFVKKDTNEFSTLQASLGNAAFDPELFTMGALGPTTLLDSSVGATPFQFPAMMQYVTILKKTKVFLPPGGVSTYQMRLPGTKKYYTSTRDEDITSRMWGKRRWTRGIWIVQKGCPDAASRASASTLRWSITRTYTLKTIDDDHVNLNGQLVT